MHKLNILLIDDDADEFDFMLSAMNKIPGIFECSYAVDDLAAITLLETYRPDYIFVDMNMPKVNGLQCIERLKGINEISNIPMFIYTTGYDEFLHKNALDVGASGCLKKPVQINQLAEMLKALYETGNPDINPGKSSKP